MIKSKGISKEISGRAAQLRERARQSIDRITLIEGIVPCNGDHAEYIYIAPRIWDIFETLSRVWMPVGEV